MSTFVSHYVYVAYRPNIQMISYSGDDVLTDANIVSCITMYFILSEPRTIF